MLIVINKQNIFEYLDVFRNFKYDKDREKDLIDKTITDIQKNRSVVYLLQLVNTKASIYLLSFIRDIAKEWQLQFGLKFIILYPDMQSESLIDFYQNLGFHKTKLIFWDNKKRETEYWMIKKL